MDNVDARLAVVTNQQKRRGFLAGIGTIEMQSCSQRFAAGTNDAGDTKFMECSARTETAQDHQNDTGDVPNVVEG